MKRFWYRNRLRRVYEQRFDIYGKTPAGSFWVDKCRQMARFDVIFSQIKKNICGEYSLADIGCGYGALVDYLLTKEIMQPRYSVSSWLEYAAFVLHYCHLKKKNNDRK